MKKYIYSIFVLVLSGMAQEIEEVKVEAFKLSPLSSNKNHHLISSSQLDMMSSNKISDALQTVPGITITKNGNNGAISIFIRGSQSYHTKILLDGMPLQDASTTQQSIIQILDQIPLSSLESIEVITGSSATIYGSDAIGGVILLKTKQALQNKGQFSSTIGSNDFYRSDLILSNTKDRINSFINVSATSYGGISATTYSDQLDKDSLKSFNILAKMNYQISDEEEYSLLLNYHYKNAEFDGFPLFQSQFQEEYINYFSFNLNYQKQNFFIDNLSLQTSFSLSDNERKNRGPGLFDNIDFSSNIIGISWLLDYQINNNSNITLGNKNDFHYASFNQDKENILHQQLYLWYQTKFYFVDLNLGVNFNHTENANKLTYEVSPVINFSDSLRLKSSFNSNFRFASLYELYGPSVGNDNLKEEYSSNSEFILEKDFENFLLSISYFRQNIKDVIAYDFIDNKYYNQDRLKTFGNEISLTYFVSDDLYFTGSYTLLNATNIENNTAKKSLRRPNQQASLNIFYKANSKVDINLAHLYKSSRNDGFSVPVKLASYNVTNINCSYQYDKHWKFNASINNIFDSKYQEVLNYNTDERTVYLGASYSF